LFFISIAKCRNIVNGTVAAKVPYSITFASRSKKNYDATKRRLQMKSCF